MLETVSNVWEFFWERVWLPRRTRDCKKGFPVTPIGSTPTGPGPFGNPAKRGTNMAGGRLNRVPMWGRLSSVPVLAFGRTGILPVISGRQESRSERGTTPRCKTLPTLPPAYRV